MYHFKPLLMFLLVLIASGLSAQEVDIGRLDLQPGEEVLRLHAASPDLVSWYAVTMKLKEGRTGGYNKKTSGFRPDDFQYSFFLDGKRFGPFEKYQQIGEPQYLATGEILVTVAPGVGNTWLYSNKRDPVGPLKDVRSLMITPDGRDWVCILDSKKGSTVYSSGKGEFGPYSAVDNLETGNGGNVSYLARTGKTWGFYSNGKLLEPIDDIGFARFLNDGTLLYSFRDPSTRKFTAVTGKERIENLSDVIDCLVSPDLSSWCFFIDRKESLFILSDKGSFGPFFKVGSPYYSSDSGTLVCTVDKEQEVSSVFRNGEFLGSGGDLSIQAISEDGKKILWQSRSDESTTLFLNGEKLAVVNGEIRGSGFDAGGNVWYYTGDEKGTLLYSGGKTKKLPGGISELWIYGNGLVSYIFENRSGYNLSVDGKVMGPYESIDHAVFDKSGKGYSFIGGNDDYYWLVWNSLQMGPYDEVWEPDTDPGKNWFAYMQYVVPFSLMRNIGRRPLRTHLLGQDGKQYIGGHTLFGNGYCRLADNLVKTGRL